MSKKNITVQLTNNDNIVKFVTKSFITQSKSYEFNNIDDARESPIAQRLFHLPFVKTIYISQNFIAIEKFPFNLTQVNILKAASIGAGVLKTCSVKAGFAILHIVKNANQEKN